MPGPGGNQPMKGKKKKADPYGRYHEGYGKLVRAKGTNPGAEVYVHEKRASDAIRGFKPKGPSIRTYGSHSPKTPFYGN